MRTTSPIPGRNHCLHIPPAIRAGGFPGEIRARAQQLRDGSAVGAFLATELERLADIATFLGAGSPLEFVERREVEEESLRDHWYRLGRDHGREDADDPR